MTDKAALEQQFRTSQPEGLWILFFSELWERFCFYGMRALLVLYMTSDILNKDSDTAYGVYGAYGALVYATPLLGGFLADRVLGTRLAIIIGAILMSAGEFAMMVQSEFVFYGAMGLICLGNGFFKPNISSTVGQLYVEGDPMRDRGFTIFYMGINIGAFLAPLACGWLGENVGWGWGFGAAGIGIVLGLIVFMWGQDKLEGAGLPPDAAAAKKWLVPIFAGSLVLVAPLYYLLANPDVTKILLYWIAGFAVVYVLYFAFTNERVVRDRVIVFLILAFFHTLFWALFEQAGSSLTIYARDCVDRDVFGTTMPTSYTQSFNPFFIIAFAPLFSWLWGWLSNKNKNPSIPAKFGLALLQLGLGYYVLVIGGATGMLTSNGLVMLLLLVFCYALHTTGELCLSPVGLSAVTKLIPPHVVSMFMGIWFLSISQAHNLAAQIAKLTGESSRFQVNATVKVPGPDGGDAVNPSIEQLAALNTAVDAQLEHLGVKIESKNRIDIDPTQTYADKDVDLMVGSVNTKLSNLVTSFRPGEGDMTPELLAALDRNVDDKLTELELTEGMQNVEVAAGATAEQLQAVAEGVRQNVQILVRGALEGYTTVWEYCSYAAVGAGLFLLLVAGLINKLAHGVR